MRASKDYSCRGTMLVITLASMRGSKAKMAKARLESEIRETYDLPLAILSKASIKALT